MLTCFYSWPTLSWIWFCLPVIFYLWHRCRFWCRCRNIVSVHHFERLWCGVCLFHGKAFLRTNLHAASTLDALHSLYDPFSFVSIHRDAVCRTFFHADAAKYAVLFYDADMPSGAFLPYPWHNRIHESGRFLKQAC